MATPRIPYDRQKIRPHSDAIREQIRALKPLTGCAIVFKSDWRPCQSWYRVEGFNLGRAFTVRQHKGRTFVFRME